MIGQMPISKIIKPLGIHRLSPREVRRNIPFSSANYAVVDEATSTIGWSNGTLDEKRGESVISVSVANGGSTSTTKDYGAPLTLGNYVIVNVYLSDENDLAWANLRLTESNTANYFQYDIAPLLSTGKSTLVLNRKFFTTGGTPAWANIQQVRFAFQATSGNSVELSFGKIETYDKDGCVSFFFDDARLGVFTNAFPIMDAATTDICANTFVISDNVDKTIGSNDYMFENQLKELSSNNWIIGNHTKEHQDLSTLSDREQEYEIQKCTEYLESINAGWGRFAFVPPYGARDETTERLIDKYFAATRWSASNDGFNVMPVFNSNRLSSFTVNNTDTPATLTAMMDEAMEYGLLLILTFHRILDSSFDNLTYLTSDFQTLISHVDANDIPVKNIAKCLYNSW